MSTIRRVACVQLRSGRRPEDNLAATRNLVREAAGEGAIYVQTPEMTNILERSRGDLLGQLKRQEEDLFLKSCQGLAAELGITLHLGSLAILRADGKVANRAFVIGPDGAIRASYDKIHMFDVDLPNGESWRESATYTPGTDAVIAAAAGMRIGLAICYDVRFPHLFRSYGQAGVDLLTAPAAFTRQTGEAHWHQLQRTRAIENGCYLISAAQGGLHEDGRETYGHSVIVDPWGGIVVEKADDCPGIVVADVDLDAVAAARQRIPSLKNERPFGLVEPDGVTLRSHG